jgi:hypothetical protein
MTTKIAKRNWLKAKYSELIDRSSDDKIELLFEAQLTNYSETQKKGYRTVLADHI